MFKNQKAIKAANNVNWVDRTTKVVSIDSDENQENLMCAILQENAESKSDFLNDHNVDWQDLINGDSASYSVKATSDSIIEIAQYVIEEYKTRVNDELAELEGNLDAIDSTNLLKPLQILLQNSTPNFAFNLRDSIFNGYIDVLYDEDGNWYLLSTEI